MDDYYDDFKEYDGYGETILLYEGSLHYIEKANYSDVLRRYKKEDIIKEIKRMSKLAKDGLQMDGKNNVNVYTYYIIFYY
jgi:hypothetical protein